MILCIALVHLGLADPDRRLMDKPPEGKHDVFLGNSQLRASNIFRTVFTSLIGLIMTLFFFLGLIILSNALVGASLPWIMP